MVVKMQKLVIGHAQNRCSVDRVDRLGPIAASHIVSASCKGLAYEENSSLGFMPDDLHGSSAALTNDKRWLPPPVAMPR